MGVYFERRVAIAFVTLCRLLEEYFLALQSPWLLSLIPSKK